MAKGAKRLVAVTAVLLLSGCLADGPTGGMTPASQARAFLREFVDILEEYSIRRDSVDWTALRAAVMAEGAGATTIEATHGALALALETLGDNHSWVRTPTGAFLDYETALTCDAAIVTSPTDLPADIGYLRIGSFSGGTLQEGAYTGAIQAAMEDQDTDQLVGWIIDLRGNGGGNMWPMLSALWPFLQGTVGHFMDADSAWGRWEVDDHFSFLDQLVLSEAAFPYAPRATDGRIAVLTDNRVASAGEATAIAFRGRPNTRTFGTATCGVPTGIVTGPIGFNYTLGLATVWMADRDSTVFGGPLPPDEVITDPAAVVTRAIAWIRTGS